MNPPPPVDLTAAAFFDVDNTWCRARRWCTSAAAWPPASTSATARWKFIYAQAKFQLTGRENSEDVAEGAAGTGLHRGLRPPPEFSALGEEIYDEIIADKI